MLNLSFKGNIMAIPKKTKSKPLSNKTDKVKQAVQMASKSNAQKEDLKIKPVKKLGRRPLAGVRSAKITFFMTQETKDRFDISFLQEQIKRHKVGEKIDKSLLIEEALKSFLNNNGY